MRHQLYCASAAATMLLATGCTTDDDNSLEIMGVPAPNEQCELLTDPGFVQTNGVYDPRAIAGIGPGAYVLPLLVRNNMLSGEDTADEPDLRPSGRDVTVLGFRVCWMRGDIEPSGNDCSDFPAGQTDKVASSGTVEGGGLHVFTIPVLTLNHLKTLYGTAFSPDDVPDFGLPFAFLSQAPDDAATRDPAWGDYPTRRDADVLLRVRAIGRRMDGGAVHSNWFDHHVQLCVGCRPTFCEPLEIAACPGETCQGELCPASLRCAAGPVCTANTVCPDVECSSDGSCVNGAPACETGLVGFIPERLGCFPFQRLGDCAEPVDDCD